MRDSVTGPGKEGGTAGSRKLPSLRGTGFFVGSAGPDSILPHLERQQSRKQVDKFDK